MTRLWQWFSKRGSANSKSAHDPGSEREKVAQGEPAPRSTAAAVDRAAHRWDERGDRADQDYYHVPGGGNQADQSRRDSEATVKAKVRKPKAERPDALK